MSTIIQLRPLQDDLADLTATAHSAAIAARQALLFETKEARREPYLNYGRALSPIRRWFKKKNQEFNNHLKRHNLEVSTTGFRTDAMWLANNWESGAVLQNSVERCPYSNPVDIRSWWRERRRYDTSRETEFDQLIKPSDNWNFNKPRYLPDRQEGTHGYIPGDLYANCLWYWTKPNDIVIAPMAGSGQIGDVYQCRREWMKPKAWDLDLRLFDLSPQHVGIRQNDLTKGLPVEGADYIVMDVPYVLIVRGQYSNDPDDLANMEVGDWSVAIRAISKVCSSAQEIGGLCTIVAPNYRNTDGTIVLAPAIVRESFVGNGYQLHDLAYASRRIQQTQTHTMGAANNNAKRSRMMLSDMAEVMTFRKTW